MQYKLKSILSFLAIGLFIIFASASLGPDKSTNTTVAIKDCEEKDAVPVKLMIDLEFDFESGMPIAGAFGKVFIVHQKVNPDETCTFAVDFQITIDFICDDNGRFSYEGPEWMHNNSEDLTRVEIYLYASIIDGYTAERVVHVKKYNSARFVYFDTVYPIL